jgi:putative endonuclease
MVTNAMTDGWWRWVLARLGFCAVDLGARGEAYAARWLKKRGMRIVGRNLRKGKGEIDLVALEGEWVVFVEVRTRSSEGFMTPEQSVRYWKRKAVTKTVRQMMRRHRGKGFLPRIDLVAIVWPEGAREPVAVRHHKGVMRVGGW